MKSRETGNTRFNCDLHQLKIIAEILNLIARPLTPESIATKVIPRVRIRRFVHFSDGYAM